MAYFQQSDSQWDTPEEEMHRLLRVPARENPHSSGLRPGVANILRRSPLVVISTFDSKGRPWMSVWGGGPGFIQSLGQFEVVIRAVVDRKHDPVVEALIGPKRGEVVEDGERRQNIAILGLDLGQRTRANLVGEMVSGALAEEVNDTGEVMLVVRVVQSFVSRPQAFIPKQIEAHDLLPRVLSEAIPLSEEIISLVSRAQMFFISSSHLDPDLDIHQRSGPAGFISLEKNDDKHCILLFPAESGIRLYQTLENSHTPTKVSVLIPDLQSGNVLFVSGTKGLLLREDATRGLVQSNVGFRISVEAVRFVENGLSFRAVPDFFSDRSSNSIGIRQENKRRYMHDEPVYANLVKQEFLAPTIARFCFEITDPTRSTAWKPGQYVIFDFDGLFGLNHNKKQNNGRSYMSEDHFRKFTVSSGQSLVPDYSHFEITIRKVGHVTDKLFEYGKDKQLKIALEGFSGEFFLRQNGQDVVAFIAAGVGITPFLAQASTIDLRRACLFWSIRSEDLGLVLDSFDRNPDLCGCTKLYVTGDPDAEGEKNLASLHELGTYVRTRRMVLEDLELASERSRLVRRWYLCTGSGLRKTLLSWLKDRNVVFETFNF